MNDQIHIPSGYKPSPLGIIPEDWEVKRLGEIARIGSGGTPSKANQEYWGGNIPWITTALLNNPYIDAVDEFITEQGLKNSSAQLLNSGVLLMAMYGQGQTRGKVSKLLIKASTNQACAFIDIHTGNTDFVHQHLIADYDSIRNKSNDGNQKNLSLGIINDIQITFPPIPEQQRIVSVLSLWDTAIEKQTALIERLTLRKRGLMQQLLTGKKRLKGFRGEWKEVRLGEVASINRGGSPRPIEQYLTKGEGFNWIKIGDVGVNAKYITSTEEKIIKEGLSKTRFVKSGDFILSNSMSFGRPYILKIDGCIHDGWLVIQEYDKTFNIDFLYYILGYDTTLAQYKSMAAGSGVLNLNKEIVKEVLLKIPPIDEQKAIASILVNADKEIEIQKQKLAAMQAQKKGLMQVLLTGKKRIKE